MNCTFPKNFRVVPLTAANPGLAPNPANYRSASELRRRRRAVDSYRIIINKYTAISSSCSAPHLATAMALDYDPSLLQGDGTAQVKENDERRFRLCPFRTCPTPTSYRSRDSGIPSCRPRSRTSWNHSRSRTVKRKSELGNHIKLRSRPTFSPFPVDFYTKAQ